MNNPSIRTLGSIELLHLLHILPYGEGAPDQAYRISVDKQGVLGVQVQTREGLLYANAVPAGVLPAYRGLMEKAGWVREHEMVVGQVAFGLGTDAQVVLVGWKRAGRAEPTARETAASEPAGGPAPEAGSAPETGKPTDKPSARARFGGKKGRRP